MATKSAGGSIRIVLEAGAKRTFARAIDWPGWSRSAKTEEDALAALAEYAPRYAKVAGSDELPAVDGVASLHVVERLIGGSGTDFGVPSGEAAADADEIDARELARLERLLGRAWSAFDRTVDGARGVELRKGPRGGGRDLDKIVEHVLGAEDAYITQLGARPPKEASPTELRAAALEALRARARGEEPANPSGARKRWSPRYYVHRSAWHILDHAWEIEDRST